MNLSRSGEPRQGGDVPHGSVRPRIPAFPKVLALSVALVGCNDPGPIIPPALRFGQVGEVRIEVHTPLGTPGGLLWQTIQWSSSGGWQLHEEITYRGLLGDRTRKRPSGDASGFASAYATLIAQVNETPGLRLFISELDPSLVPDCGAGSSTVILEIEDTSREETARWVRCGQGSLEGLQPQGAGPDLDASRVVAAVASVRDYTLDSTYRSPYLGSLPFGTLDRGEDSGVPLEQPLVFRPEPVPGGGLRQPGAWVNFWRDHTRGSRPPPQVDWTREMVVAGAVGLRSEAGDSVRVQRILQVTGGAIVELVERVPGDFCSPASRNQYPFHIVVVPLTPPDVQFADVRVERIPCGF